MSTAAELPLLDEHRLRITAPRARVWEALEGYAERHLRANGLLARLLGTEPAGGFAPVEVEPAARLVLAGRHRFSRYRMTWLLEDGADDRQETGSTDLDGAGDTVLRVVSHAAFPGLHGEVYRTLVVRSRLHVLVTRRLLRQVARRALAPS